MSTSRNALGRGLGALLPGRPPGHIVPAGDSQESASNKAQRVSPGELPVDLIDPNPEQPRRAFDAANLDQLSESIQRHGVLQPVVVRKAGERFELIVGERRWRAARAAGLHSIPAVVADAAPHDRLELAIVENIQRQDLNPIELAYAYRALAEAGATQEEIGRKVSKDRSSVANHLRLLELSREIQQDVEAGRLTMGHAKALLQVTNPERRQHLRNRALRDQLSVRETEELGREIAGPASPRRPRPTKPPAEPLMRELVETLQRQLQARVRIKGTPRRGKIEVEYSSSEDLDRLVKLILEGA
jgi:ParB family chromosome partitioning protein